jgi:hypothetical protein
LKLRNADTLASVLSGSSGHELIPYIDRFLTTEPYAGLYEVDDRPYQTRSVDRRHLHYHPSGDCLKCQRLLYFERDESVDIVERSFDARTQAIFKIGSSTHAMIQAWFEAMGKLDGYPEFIGNEVRLDDKRYNMGGYMDSQLVFPGDAQATVIELKTINSYQFGMLSGPKLEHKLQVGCYMLASGLPSSIVLYWNKDTQEMKEFRVEPFDMQPTLMRWQQVEEALDAEDLSRLQYGCKPGSREWQWCPAKDFCFRL